MGLSAESDGEVTAKSIPTVGSQEYALSGRVVTSKYGYREDPFTGEQKLHSGVDTRAEPDNSPALIGGVVNYSGPAGPAGKIVTIKNKIDGQNFYSSTQHLEKSLFEKGDEVTAGQNVGIPGNTGYSDGKHNHHDIFTYQGDTELVKKMIEAGVESHTFPDRYGQRTTFNPEQAINYFIEEEIDF